MRAQPTSPVSYQIPVGEAQFPVSDRIGRSLSLAFSGRINCIECGRETKKSFSQGYCYPCFKSLAECDMCIMKPETCHHHNGTCRDPGWAESHCMQDHIVYLANSSGIKVGITRGTQIPTRWIDQGAMQAIPVYRVKNRLHSGLLEITIKKQVSDRTDWRKLLKGEPERVDMVSLRDTIRSNAGKELELLRQMNSGLEWEELDDDPIELSYPVNHYPEKVTSLNFDKTPEISGVLNGIKGQYLLLDCGVLNIRKFTGYEVQVLSP